ncbi:hypothetical protein DITRI_Ditri04bG0153600 [Diplodiscus trichospermus]
MAAAFCSGALFSLVSGMGGSNQAANAVTSGLFFALVQGGIFQVGQKFSQPPAEDVCYSRTRSMLNSLGLQNYEKNFKKGLLTDSTLPLLTDSALRDVKIPPGPRLLILDHIQRFDSIFHGPRIEREAREPWVKFYFQAAKALMVSKLNRVNAAAITSALNHFFPDDFWKELQDGDSDNVLG